MNENNSTATAALQGALRSTAAALRASPKALLAVAALASTGMAHAQLFGGAYERAGGNIGYELGRQVNSSAQGIATIMGQVLGGQLGRQFDEGQRAEQERAQAIERARIDAAAQAAYDAERQRLDPSYAPGAGGYAGIAQRGAASTGLWNQTGLSGVDRNIAAAVREIEMRNQRTQTAAPQPTFRR